MNKKILLLPISIIGGVIVALLTGFISSPGRFIDVFRYGYPFPWITRLIPMRFPIILVGNLVADMAIWTIIIGILLLAAVGARHLIAKSSIPVRQETEQNTLPTVLLTIDRSYFSHYLVQLKGPRQQQL